MDCTSAVAQYAVSCHHLPNTGMNLAALFLLGAGAIIIGMFARKER